MKIAKNKLMRNLYILGLMLIVAGISNFARAYNTAAAETAARQPLITIGLQAPIDGAILLPSTPPPGQQGDFVFTYRCPEESTAGSLPSPTARTASGTATLRVPGSMAKPGYQFIGWRNGNHIFQPFQTFQLPENGLYYYFYAVWAPVVFLTLDPNGGTSATHTLRRAAGTQIRNLPPPPTREGHIFIGWFNTPEASGGARFTARSTIPSTDTTYWARWRTPFNITVYYENLVNTNTADTRNLADTTVNEIRQLFMANFGINLVQQPGTTRYVPALNQAGTSAPDILDINPSNNATVIFRFVDFPLNEGRIAGLARQVRGIEGTPLMNLGDIVVTTELTPEMFRRAVVHEISHIFGAHDCSSPRCVMDISRVHTVHDRWCGSCRTDVFHYLYIRMRNNPHLGN